MSSLKTQPRFATGGIVVGFDPGNSTASTTVSTLPSTGGFTYASAGTNGMTYTLNYSASTSWKVTPIPEKVRNGKYRVRCRGCARWAKIISEKRIGMFPAWRVHCERCFGENEGFAA